MPNDDQRQRMIRRIIRVHRDACNLGIEPAIVSLQLALVATENATADRTPNPAV